MKTNTIHLFLGIALLLSSFLGFSFALTGFTVLDNPIKLNFVPAVVFLFAVFEFYLAVKVK
jgi:hypothetical protein